MDWIITTSVDKNGKTIYNITVNASLYNNSSTKYSKSDMNNLAAQMKQQVSDVFNVSNPDFEVNMNFNLKVANSLEDIGKNDHVFQVIDQADLVKETNNNSDVLAKTSTPGLSIKMGTDLVNSMLNGTNTDNRTVAHELGHTGGLGEANVKGSKISSTDQRTNIMAQTKFLQLQKIQPSTARSLTNGQIREINYNYKNNMLNHNSPIRSKTTGISVTPARSSVGTMPIVRFNYKKVWK